MVLTPDEGQGDLYREKLGPNDEVLAPRWPSPTD